MNDHLGQVKRQLETLEQLESVMTAMRGIAAARLHEANTHLQGIHVYATTIASAIGQVLAFVPQDFSEEIPNRNSHNKEKELVVVLTAEQGFAGAYNERIINTAIQHTQKASNSGILLVGHRGQIVARNKQLEVLDSLSMVTRVNAISSLAVTLADHIYRYIYQYDYSQVSIIYPHREKSGETTITIKMIVPFDYSPFKVVANLVPPLLTLEPKYLLNKLAEEYVFAMLCRALTVSHAIENEERVRAMVRARSNVENTRETLTGHYQQLRQEQITAEISELTTGRLANL